LAKTYESSKGTLTR